jgi:hypothetical protein
MMLTKGMILVIIGISGLIITLGIGAYTSRKNKQQLENAESASSTLSLSEQLTRRKETKTMAPKDKKHEQTSSITLQPLPDFSLGNEEKTINKVAPSKVHPEQNEPQVESRNSIAFGKQPVESIPVLETIVMSESKADTKVVQNHKKADHQVHPTNSDIIAETTIMNTVDETLVMQQPKDTSDVKQTTILKRPDKETKLENDDRDKTLILNQSMK